MVCICLDIKFTVGFFIKIYLKKKMKIQRETVIQSPPPSLIGIVDFFFLLTKTYCKILA